MTLALRGAAVLIAIAALIDPAVTTSRTTRPAIAVVDAGGGDARADRIADRLGDDYTVLRAPFAGAAATVVVGTELGRDASAIAQPAFVVIPDDRVMLTEVNVPAQASIDARVPVEVVARVRGGADDNLIVTLMLGDVVVDRTTVPIGTDDAAIRVPLSFVSAAPGAASLRVTASVNNDVANANVVVAMNDRRGRVHFHDARPSWTSTFVRRALERDPRFDVTGRVVTSRAVAVGIGAAPASLADVADDVDVIVVGAPEALGATDISELEAFLRARGGAVLLLPDHRGTGPYERLLPAIGREERVATSVSIRPADNGGGDIRAAVFAGPERPVPAHDVYAADSAGRPMVWRIAVGAGKLWVSGAFDAWRFRDPDVSSFDRFWQTAVAHAADGAAPSVEIDVANTVLRPGEAADVRVLVRSAALAVAADEMPVRATVRATFNGAPLRLWPDGPVGSLRAIVRAPDEPGTYSIEVATDDAQAQRVVRVADDVSRVRPATDSAMAAWAASRGGVVVPESRLDDLAGLLGAALERPAASRVTWHPMRSAWWIVPFALMLSAEWWLRRRRGLS